MKPFLSIIGFAAVVLAGESLRTEYSDDTTLRVSRETSVSMSTTQMSFERDGEPIEGFGREGGGETETTKRVVYEDRIQEVKNGAPVRLKRTFESVEGEAILGDQDVSLEAPLTGKTLLLTSDEGTVEAELEEGSLEDDEMLLGHRMTLSLDLLLPPDPVTHGDTWEPENGKDLLIALGIDLDEKLFLPPQFDFGGWGRGRREGGGGRGSRRMGGGTQAIFQQADWDVSATFMEQTDEFEGEECLVVKIEAEASGELEDRSPEWSRREFSVTESTPSLRGTEFEIEMTGRLLFSRDAGRPVHFEIKGELSTETDREFSRGDSSMRIQRSQEGTFEQTVTVSQG
ncbi:MAG: hypothetical protein CMJ89_17530 [Planctomycetes bacterium]|nr:hypothetical protein [Planctomycetota bacterium]